MAVVTKEEYLKKYLSGNDKEKKKKIKKKKSASSVGNSRMKIVDDDVDFKSLLPSNVNNTLDEDIEKDNPTVADVIDERPKELQILEKYRVDKRWKLLEEPDGSDFNSKQKESSSKISTSSQKRRHDSDSDVSPIRGIQRDSDSDIAVSRPSKRHDSDSDRSLTAIVLDKSKKKSRNGSELNTSKKKSKRHDSDSDVSVERVSRKRRNYSDSDASPERSKGRNQSRQDRYYRETERHDKKKGYSDHHERNEQKHHKRSLHKGDYRTQKSTKGHRERSRSYSSGESPKRERKYKKSGGGSLRDARNRRDMDSDSGRRKRRTRFDSEESQRRKQRRNYSDSDESTERRLRDHSGSVQSPLRKPRRNDSDESARKTKKRNVSNSDQSPRRLQARNDSDSDQSLRRRKTRNDSDSDQSPRRTQSRNDSDSDQSPQRRKTRNDSDSDQSFEDRQFNKRLKGGRSHFDRKSSKSSKQRDPGLSEESRRLGDEKMKRTLGGAKAGLSTGREVREEAMRLVKKEEEMFSKIGDDQLGRHAATVHRDKKGRRRNLEEEKRLEEEEAKKKSKKDAKYQKWGKGLAQISEQETRTEDALYEMSKTLTRHKDDEDLEAMLKGRLLDGDPMAEFMKKKHQKKSGNSDKGKEKPRYSGRAPPPNRFNIWPGYRWDGVDRSNGFEKKLLSSKVNRKVDEEIAYKWSTEDM